MAEQMPNSSLSVSTRRRPHVTLTPQPAPAVAFCSQDHGSFKRFSSAHMVNVGTATVTTIASRAGATRSAPETRGSAHGRPRRVVGRAIWRRIFRLRQLGSNKS